MFSIRRLVVSFYLVSVSAGYAQTPPPQPDASQVTQTESVSPNSEEELATANKLNQQVEDYYQQGKYQLAIPVAERVLVLREKILGEEHPDVAESLNNLAELYRQMGKYARAEPLFLRALEIQEQTLRKEHPEVATSLNNLALLYESMGKYARAEPLFLRALNIRKNTLGKEHPLVAASLNNLAELYKTMGEYARAEPLFLRALKIMENTLGEEHADVATILNNLAGLYKTMGEYARAEPLYLRALEILEKTFREEHPLVAASLNNLASLYQTMGKYARAEQRYLHALEMFKKTLGEEHSSVALSLNNLALLYQTMGKYARAEQRYLRALEIQEQTLGEKHPLVATSLNNLASLYHSMGEYARAKPLFLRALNIRKNTLGEEHPLFAKSLNNLAALYDSMGKYARAEPRYLRALKIMVNTLGEEHPSVATSLNNMALLSQTMGEYARAEPLYLRALEIRKKTLGEEHPLFAKSLNNLAALYQTMGEYARAEPLYQRALDIWQKKLGKEHPNVATGLNNLAALYKTMGEYARAEPLYRQALDIRKKTLGEEHPDVATSLNNLALLYDSMGEYARAEPLFKGALKIFKKTLGEKHPLVATSLNNLAGLYQTMGEYARAEPLYRQALEIRKKTLGEEHPDVANSLNNLAWLYESMGEYARAEPLYKQALFIAIQNDEPLALWTVQGNLSALLAKQNQLDAAILWGKQAVNLFQTTRLKARKMDKQLQKSFLKQEGDKYQALAENLLTRQRLSEAQQVLTMHKEREYADFVQRDPKSDPRQTRVTYTDFEQTWANQLEAIKTQLAQIGPERNRLKLNAKEPDLSETEKQRLAVLNNQLQGLEKDFYRFLEQAEQAFQTPPPVQFKGQPQPSSLPALQKWLKQLGNGVVLLEYLVTKEKLHLLVTTTDKQIHRTVLVSKDDLNQSITRFRNLMNVDKTDTNSKPESASLYNWLIKPIANDLKPANAQTLLLSLDGKLRYLPMAALYDVNCEQYLIEQYTLIRYTQAGKHLIDRPQKRLQLAVVGLGLSDEIEGFEPLDAVEDELNGIIRQNEEDDEGVIDGVIYLNQDFNTDNLQNALQQAEFPFMHIASHFVFGENEQKSYLLLGDGSQLSLKTLRKDYQFKYLDLLTLSACNTAMGDNTTGKEIDGLSVTVQDNGAKAVIATLWPVYDDSTGEFMQRMYKLHVEDELSQAAAIRQTQQEFIEADDYDHPYYWAPFILMGNGF